MREHGELLLTPAAAVAQQAACFISSLMWLSGCAFATTFTNAQALRRMRWEREGGRRWEEAFSLAEITSTVM